MLNGKWLTKPVVDSNSDKMMICLDCIKFFNGNISFTLEQIMNIAQGTKASSRQERRIFFDTILSFRFNGTPKLNGLLVNCLFMKDSSDQTIELIRSCIRLRDFLKQITGGNVLALRRTTSMIDSNWIMEMVRDGAPGLFSDVEFIWKFFSDSDFTQFISSLFYQQQ